METIQQIRKDIITPTIKYCCMDNYTLYGIMEYNHEYFAFSTNLKEDIEWYLDKYNFAKTKNNLETIKLNMNSGVEWVYLDGFAIGFDTIFEDPETKIIPL